MATETETEVLDVRTGVEPVVAVAWPQEFGAELALILRRAHDAVQAMEADARLQVSDLRVQAHHELARLRVEAEKYAEAIRAEAEAYAATLRAEAERYSSETRELARQTAEANLALTRELRQCWSQLATSAPEPAGAPPATAPEPWKSPFSRPAPARSRAQRTWDRAQPSAPTPAPSGQPFFAGLINGGGGVAPA